MRNRTQRFCFTFCTSAMSVALLQLEQLTAGGFSGATVGFSLCHMFHGLRYPSAQRLFSVSDFNFQELIRWCAK